MLKVKGDEILTERWMRCTVWFAQVEDCSCGTCCGEGKPFRVEKRCSRLRVVLLGRYHYTMTITLYFELILRHSLVSESKLQCYKIGIGGHYVPKSPWEETIFKNYFHSAHRVTTTTRVTVAKVSKCKL